jgi:hypothetical protein
MVNELKRLPKAALDVSRWAGKHPREHCGMARSHDFTQFPNLLPSLKSLQTSRSVHFVDQTDWLLAEA